MTSQMQQLCLISVTFKAKQTKDLRLFNLYLSIKVQVLQSEVCVCFAYMCLCLRVCSMNLHPFNLPKWDGIGHVEARIENKTEQCFSPNISLVNVFFSPSIFKLMVTNVSQQCYMTMFTGRSSLNALENGATTQCSIEKSM